LHNSIYKRIKQNARAGFGTSEAARLLKVERNVIKTVGISFSDYFKPEANP